MINNKPVICVTNDSETKVTGETTRRSIVSPSAYSRAIAAAGGVPVLTGERCPEELALLCDALLLTGGDDVDPEVYGQEILNETVKPDPLRTQFELPLINAFLERGKPILCICRGFQILNCVLGGTLLQDLVEQRGWVHMNSDIRHLVYAEDGSVLQELFGKEFRVNSTHHQALDKIGEGLKITARSVEGIPEAFEHESLPILGTQFHPERLTGYQWDARTADFAPYFEHFINIVRAHCEAEEASEETDN